jgi:hypothetical protein
MLRGLVSLAQNSSYNSPLHFLRQARTRGYATSTKNPYEKLVRKLNIGSREYKYFSLAELKDSRLGKFFCKMKKIHSLFTHEELSARHFNFWVFMILGSKNFILFFGSESPLLYSDFT